MDSIAVEAEKKMNRKLKTARTGSDFFLEGVWWLSVLGLGCVGAVGGGGFGGFLAFAFLAAFAVFRVAGTGSRGKIGGVGGHL